MQCGLEPVHRDRPDERHHVHGDRHRDERRGCRIGVVLDDGDALPGRGHDGRRDVAVARRSGHLDALHLDGLHRCRAVGGRRDRLLEGQVRAGEQRGPDDGRVPADRRQPQQPQRPAVRRLERLLPADGRQAPTGTTSSAVYAVAAQEDTSPGSSDFRHVIGWGAAGTGQGRVLEKGSFNSKVYLETYATWPSATVTKNWPVSTAVLTDGVITSTSVTSTMNASPSYSFSATNNTGTSAGAAVGATGWNTSGVWKGRIAEVVVLASNPTAAENRQVQEYLARKWGLTIAPGLVSGVTATASTTTDAAVNVAWTAPTWNGGASISSYTVTATPSDGTLSTVTTSCARHRAR